MEAEVQVEAEVPSIPWLGTLCNGLFKLAVDKGLATTLEAQAAVETMVTTPLAKGVARVVVVVGATNTVLCKKSTYAGRVPLVSYMNVLLIRIWPYAYGRGWLGCLG